MVSISNVLFTCKKFIHKYFWKRYWNVKTTKFSILFYVITKIVQAFVPSWGEFCDALFKKVSAQVLKERFCMSLKFVVMIPIKNRWSIIFDWSVGQQSIFFSTMEFRSSIFYHSILEWSNDRFFPFFFPIFFYCFYCPPT